jgi:hypothetical protein
MSLVSPNERSLSGTPDLFDPKKTVDEDTRWGRQLLISDGRCVWWAREDLSGGEPVCFAIAVMAQEALRKGEMNFKPCSTCEEDAIHGYDDYICRNCRLLDGA